MKIRLALLLIFLSSALYAQDIFDLTSQVSFKQLMAAHAAVKREYVNSKVPDKELEYQAIQGMLKALNDPYTRFLNPQQAIEMKKNLAGKSGLPSPIKTDIFFNKVGYIRLERFEGDTLTQTLIQVLMQFKSKKIKTVVLDLRNNNGGLLNQAVAMANVLLPNSILVQMIMRDGKPFIEKSSGVDGFESMAFVVMVNNKTASSAEILAGALKDNKRALIVGQQTFGKTSIQKVIDLPDGSAILLTVGRYLTPNGLDISKKGIEVDKFLAGTPDQQLQQAAELAILEGYKRK